jgi:hypothetical protein
VRFVEGDAQIRDNHTGSRQMIKTGSPFVIGPIVHQFRQNPRRDFFLRPAKGPRSAPKTDPVRDRVIALRKENLSIYDISRNLAHAGNSSVRSPLHGFSRTKGSRGCRAGLTMSAHPDHG